LAYYELKEFDTALIHYQNAFKGNPTDPGPLDKIGKIYEDKGNLVTAAQVYSQAADLYLKSHDLERAIENWSRSVILQPENLAAHTKLAMLYEKTGKKNEAVSEFLICASLMQHSGDQTKALQVTQYAQQMVPNHPDVIRALNQIKSNQMLPKPSKPIIGIPKKAADKKKQLDSPKSSEPAGMAPVVEARQKALSELAAMLFDTPDESPANGQISRRGAANTSRGTGGLSLGNLERGRILKHLGQAIESQSQGNDAVAAEELEFAIELGFNRSAGFFDLGYLQASKKPDKALQNLRLSVKNPNYALGSYLLMGEILDNSGKVAEAATAYIQAMALADAQSVPSEQSETLRQLYEPILESQSRQKDQTVLKKICENVAAQLHRSDWRAHLKNARAQLPTEEGSAPLPLIEMMLESSSGQLVESLVKIQKLVNMHLYRTAMEEAYFALQYAQTFMPLHVMMGDILIKQGHLQDAVEKYLLVSNLYHLRGESSQAITLLTRVVEIAPMDLALRGKLIDLLLSQERVDETIQQYIKLADMYYQLAELDLAKQAFTNASRLTQDGTGHRDHAILILNRIADIDLQKLDLRSAL
ncbi:MAG: tetratricopeptide repeat protein, partial [Anaerolineaceae bacterium]|nr:tetratricopeptide repeat protein [Anaerolineaceae bacterium]